MSKVLLVIEAVARNHATRLLRLLGIDYEVAYFTGDLITPQGTIAWNNDSAIRNFLRTYDAVLVGLRAGRLDSNPVIHRAFRWLPWNDPDDPPVAYLGVYPRAGYADINASIPSDFPIIRPDNSNPSGTTASFAMSGFANNAGIRVRLWRENQEIYLPTSNLFLNSAGTSLLYLLEMSLHGQLGANGEILATPVGEDLTFPSNAVCAYRYRNRYLMPMSYNTGGEISGVRGQELHAAFWVFYALKLMGVQAQYRLPLFLSMDDAFLLHLPPAGSESILPTLAQFARIGYETYRYLAEVFYPRTGCPMICGLNTGGRYGRTSIASVVFDTHWDLVMEGRRWRGSSYQSLDSETRSWLQQWHDVLVRHHPEALPCTPHDHSILHRANSTHTNFRRHSDAGYPYAAPNDVPITRGSTLVKASYYPGTVPSDARERYIDGERYYEWGFSATSGTGDVIASLRPNNIHAARVWWEQTQAEMRALGFPDGHGGSENRLLIAPFGNTGDVSLWRVWKEYGIQLVRCDLPNDPDYPQDLTPVPPSRVFEGLHFCDNMGIDFSNHFDATFGLYHPSYSSRTAVGVMGLDVSGDITGIWDTDRPTASARAYRRAIARSTDRWLRCAFLNHALMMHPYCQLSWADVSDPLRPFSPSDPNSRINPLLEVAWNMEKVVQVLDGYLKFGTVKEYVAARERVMNR